jgi:hypothetical protein
MEFVELARRSRTLVDLGIFETDNFNVGSGEQAFWVRGARASASLFRVVGGTPLLGRTYLPEEDRAGGPALVVLSERLWRKSFGADRAIVGSRLVIDGVARTVVGVIPASAQIPDPSEAGFFVPLGLQADPGVLSYRTRRTYLTVARF